MKPRALLVFAALFASRVASAEALYAPVGGRAVALGDGRVGCADPVISAAGWALEPDGRAVRPPASDDAVGTAAALRVAPDVAHCAGSTASVTLLAVGRAPQVDPASVTVDVDSGTLTLRGRGLRGAVLRWTAGARAGDDVCTDPQPAGAGQDSCTLALARGLSADPSALALALFPAGARTGADVVGYDALGRRLTREDTSVRVARMSISALLPSGAGVDVASGAARVPLAHPEAVAAVECAEATCELDGGDLLVRGAQATGDALAVRLRLRPHTVLVRSSAPPDSAPTLSLALQRCPVAIVSAAPLRGVGDERVVVRVGGRCARDASLAFDTGAGDAVVERREVVGDASYFVVRLERVDGAEVPVTVRRGDSTVGVARAATRPLPTGQSRLELAGFGAIDFIPTNRDARLRLPAADGGLTPVPVAVAGVYTVRRDASGADLVRGVDGAAGSVALRLAFRDPTLPPPLRETDLATLTEPIDRAIHEANVPVPLGALALTAEPFIELVCGDGRGHAQRLTPGATTSLPFRSRDSCRLVIHRERLRAEDGAQQMTVTVDVGTPDGTARPSAHQESRLVLRPGNSPRFLYLHGVEGPFDRVTVRAALAADDTHYVMAQSDRVVAPQVQWTVIMGDDRFRIYATTAIPTGLFRVAGQIDYSGLLTLNAGALLRGVLLTREGIESPVGLEAGVMWLNIPGDASGTGRNTGQIAVVAGVGVGVPIANRASAGQTSINIHAWGEYEVSRALGLGGGGSPFGFIFGPSLSIGDVGANF